MNNNSFWQILKIVCYEAGHCITLLGIQLSKIKTLKDDFLNRTLLGCIKVTLYVLIITQFFDFIQVDFCMLTFKKILSKGSERKNWAI